MFPYDRFYLVSSQPGPHLEGALEAAILYLDSKFVTRNFKAVDFFLNNLDLNKVCPAIIVGILAFTAPYRNDLHIRSLFVDMAKLRLAEEMSPEEVADQVRFID